MKTPLIGGAALLASAAAFAQVAPASPEPARRADRVQSRAEVQARVAEHFAKVDANRDGSITRNEADTAMQAFHAKFAERAKDRRDDRRDNAFERLDTDRDGAVSRSEWDAGAVEREQRIASRDHNGDGRPDARGFRHGGMGGMGGHMFEMADANKDGRVTLQEAQAAALQHFDMADANRDGQITPEERRQLHERMRARHRG
jgi:Ca2+-binding EF-hand superfamily protein